MDNRAVRRQQLDKLARLKAERNEAEVQQALDALTRYAETGTGNLLEAAVQAARVKATVGEISYALETVYGRHRAEVSAITGVYRAEMGRMDGSMNRIKELIDAFEAEHGRRPRILVAKMGQDGHDRGQKVIASAFADLGFDVDIGPLFQTPEEAARQAVENDVHIVGVSSLAAGHLTLVPALREALEEQGRGDIMIVVGGVIPPQDYPALHEAGAKAIFGPGTPIADAAIDLLKKLGAAGQVASGRRVAAGAPPGLSDRKLSHLSTYPSPANSRDNDALERGGALGRDASPRRGHAGTGVGMSVKGAPGARAVPVAGHIFARSRDLFAGLIASVITIAYGLSFAALIFAPPLNTWLAYGIAATFITSADQRRVRGGAQLDSLRHRRA